jgi:Uma2 family endonuclease
MAIMVLDPYVDKQVLAERSGLDSSQYDEVWDGVYIVMPISDDEHQGLVSDFRRVLTNVMGRPGLGEVFPGVNLSDIAEGWEKNYCEPDVAVFLKSGRAIDRDTHWQGAADFLVEITNPVERTRWKIPFYSRMGGVELLVVDGDPWSLELYCHENGQLTKVGQSTLDAPDMLESRTVGLTFQLIPGEPRPRIQVTHPASGRQWGF